MKEKEKIRTLDGAFDYISQLEEKLKRSQEQEKKFRKLDDICLDKNPLPLRGVSPG